MRLAAIDIGTNSVRLLVADAAADKPTVEGNALVPVERLMRITRLGQGVNATGMLAPDAIERTVAVLREYRAVMDAHGVDGLRMTATSAARDAGNRDVFFEAAEAAVGARPELIGGEEEGRLSFLGATA
jgi:exopolyphosphatase/guanosine-5'-triphosphate,3'-diphosphate pyrophosphatase